MMAAKMQFEFVETADPCAMNGCDNDSSVYVTSAQLDLAKTPFCSVCAPLKFAQWMVAMHVRLEVQTLSWKP